MNMEPKFSSIKLAVEEKFKSMVNTEMEIFRTNTTGNDLWDTYLNSFPPGTNEIYRERTEHDCSCCKNFIRQYGNLVAVDPITYKLVSIWDINPTGQTKELGFYIKVAKAMATAVKNNRISTVFRTKEHNAGVDHNYELLENKDQKKWEHFHFDIPDRLHSNEPGRVIGSINSFYEVLGRGLNEITKEAAELVLELISNTDAPLLRGQEHANKISTFMIQKNEFDSLDQKQKTNFVYTQYPTSAIRNSVIGTLLVDLSNDVPADIAVRVYEKKVDPLSYKRPTSIVTKSMIANAKKKVEELGYTSALQRRHATIDDITVDNVIYLDRTSVEPEDVFGDMESEVIEDISKKTHVNAEEISFTELMQLSTGTNAVEMLFEQRHVNNLVSIIAPEDPDSKHIFSWENNFSWSYHGEVTDSIKYRVAKAGGSVTGALRCSLSWFNTDDLDIHVVEPSPSNHHIYHGSRISLRTEGKLDIDMNVGNPLRTDAVENITWPRRQLIVPGTYQLNVKNYTKRMGADTGYELEVECQVSGKTYNGVFGKSPYNGKTDKLVTFIYDEQLGITSIDGMDESTKTNSKIEWGIGTLKFHRVKLICNSPNHWGGTGPGTGNKHTFFILDKCYNPGETRGLYNEFLDPALTEHRKVLEIVGSKLKVPKAPAELQLSGLGFSSTIRTDILCRLGSRIYRLML